MTDIIALCHHKHDRYYRAMSIEKLIIKPCNDDSYFQVSMKIKIHHVLLSLCVYFEGYFFFKKELKK